jgi:hypothetical protein
MTLISRIFLSTDQLAAIGSIAVESSYLEDYIEELIRRIAHFDDDLASVFMPKSMMRNKIIILKLLASRNLKRKKKKAKFIDNLLDRIATANSDRVSAIHGIWEPIAGKPTGLINYLLMPPSAKLPVAKHQKKGKSQLLHSSRLEGIATTISDLHQQLYTFASDEWPPLKKRPKSPPKS